MTRPRRKPAPPGRIRVCCSHRLKDAEPRHVTTLQMTADPESPHGIMVTALGGPPIEGHAYSFRCPEPTCGRHLKIARARFVPLVVALAEQQNTHGDTPIVVDIARIERAL